ncbi:MAG: 16S rRNA (adenine(1518)-N(6)/adenine(1519)-N(6))-dimethyltransferase RsmA [Thermonemataceae bacterium]
MVKPKKYLGQHFLKDKAIAQEIVSLLASTPPYQHLLEIGPGTGVLTDFLLNRTDLSFHLIDIDKESVAFLCERYPKLAAEERILQGDFLQMDLQQHFGESLGIIGNFPYNISSQIFFKVLSFRQQVKEVVCMLQKEVAERIASPPGSKQYGILSVFLQAFYHISYHFTVPARVFIPPPKVESGVIRLERNTVTTLPCDEKKFFQFVKMAFNQRRKTLRNSLKPFIPAAIKEQAIFSKRPEQLSVDEFVSLTQQLTALQNT